MASEIRVNKINSSTGVGTITLSPTGVDISGITTVSTLKVGTGLTASEDGDIFFTGVCTATTFAGSGANLTALPAAQLTGSLPAISGANLTGIAATDNVRTGILDVAGVSTFRNTMNVGAAVTISESGIEASGIGITVANINGAQIGGRRNLIINGAMEIHQRADGNYTTLTGGYGEIDRFHIYANPASKLTYEQDTEAPVGFSKSFKITSSSAYTPTSGNYFYVGQRIEGNNWKHLEYGTSNAKTVTISFWVRSSITGTWSGIVKNSSQDRTFPWEYTISSANTWEKKSVTVIGCPDGTWATDNTDSAWIYFCIGSSTSGTTYLGSANSWQSSNLIGTTGSNSLPNTNGATWYMTGLQVELGTQMTEFEYRTFAEELDLCRRYCQVYKSVGNYTRFATTIAQSSSSIRSIFYLKKQLRAVPTFSYSGNFQCANATNFDMANMALESSSTGLDIVVIKQSGMSVTAQSAFFLAGNDDTSATITFNSEI